MLQGISEVVNILLMSGCFSVDVRDVNDKEKMDKVLGLLDNSN